MNSQNITAADVVASASFVLAAFALLATDSAVTAAAYPKAYYATTQRLVEEVARIKKKRRYRRPG